MQSRLTLILAFALAGAFPITAPAQTDAINYTWTNADQDRNWMNGDNWDPTGPPNATGHMATIPDMASQNDYPVFDTSTPQTIGWLVIEGDDDDSGIVELTLAGNSTTARVLTVAARDGVRLESGYSTIRLEEKAELRVTGGGYLGPLGVIVFDASSGDPVNNPPKFLVGEGTTLTIDVPDTAYGPVLQGVTKGLITGEVAPSNDKAETLVFGTGTVMEGTFNIDVTLVNNGAVHTSTNGDPGTIHLLCHPKSGSGFWFVDGGTQQDDSELFVEAGLVTSAAVQIDKEGWLRIQRPTCIIQRLGLGDYRFRLNEGGNVVVRQDRVFDANRWPKQCVEE